MRWDARWSCQSQEQRGLSGGEYVNVQCVETGSLRQWHGQLECRVCMVHMPPAGYSYQPDWQTGPS